MQEIISYIKAHKEQYIEELKEFLRIPSISALPENKEDVNRAAEFIKRKIEEAGISTVRIYQTEGHPLVYAEWLGAPGKPTVLIYGHYDVQPVDPIELWDNQPFDPIVKNNKIWARGATDDKGQLFVHIKSVEAFFKTNGCLPLNVKYILEGEEEIGSESLEAFISNNKDLLKADCVLVSDTSLFKPMTPTLTYGLRGLAFVEVEVKGPEKDLHSGTYGGAVANPINVLAEIITKLKDKKGKVSVPGFYDNVIKPTKVEREKFKALKFSDKQFQKETGSPELTGEEGYSTLERIWTRPALDCNGIYGGFTGQGAKTIIPSTATAKISMRLVPNQEPAKVAKDLAKYIKSIAPKTVKVKVTPLHGGYPVYSPINHPSTAAAAKAMEMAFGKKTVFMKDGGSIPVIATFSKKLKLNPILMGIGLDSENLHSPNEYFDLTHFELGIMSSAYFLNEYSK